MRFWTRLTAAATLTIGVTASVMIFAQTQNPVELGKVAWLRDMEQATRQSRDTSKPILLLFQEIPGCQTCRNFGNQPLSHPLLVEAMEDLFVPMAVYNNKKGMDEALLAKFNEPSWNNPVIRYINADGKDIIPRKDHVWDVPHTASRMIDALRQSDRPVPAYLQIVAEEPSSKTEVATFAMHCFWEGEGHMGSVNGVLDTESAWVGSKEVVHVTFDPKRVSFQALIEQALQMKCASTIFANDEQQLEIGKSVADNLTQPIASGGERRTAKESDQKYYLRNSPLRDLPLTALQATKINAALHAGESATDKLSPRQRAMLN